MPKTTRQPAGGHRRLTFDDVRAVAFGLPGVVEGTCYGTPAFRVRGRLLARLKEDGETLALNKVEFEERDALIASDPTIYSVTDHYLNYPVVLVRFGRMRPKELHALLERSWRRIAPKRLQTAYDSERPTSSGRS